MNKRRKVLHVVEAFGGGVFSFLVDLINNTSNEFDITILYSIREQTPQYFKKYFNTNIKFIESKYLAREINLYKDYKAIQEVKKVIKEIKPDIVHLHSSKAGAIGRLAVNSKKNKVIYTPHGFSFLKKDDSKIKRFIYWFIEKLLSLKCGNIVGCSVGEHKEALNLSKNSLCVNNGIDINKLENIINKLEINKNINKRICTIGRISYQKNPKLFNDIALELKDYEFTWIGDGEQRDCLNAHNIKITGWLNREDVIKELNKNTFFILTSLWEGLPISLLEAMYMKKICIVSNVIGNKDVIQDGINGYVCNDFKEYSLKVSNIVENLDLYTSITNKAYEDICNNYNVLNMAEGYKNVYNSK
jgi:glycosyltransferase involved in cell wall biosynthesis